MAACFCARLAAVAWEVAAMRKPGSAGSVAAHWRDGFLIGGVLDHQVLICKTPP